MSVKDELAGLLSVGAPTANAKTAPALPNLEVGVGAEKSMKDAEANASAGAGAEAGYNMADVTPPALLPPAPVPVVPIANTWDGMTEMGSGVITPDGDPTPIQPWNGDPTSPIMPGEIVYYWLTSSRPNLLVPHTTILLGRTPGNGYTGIRLLPQMGGIRTIACAMPSDVPKRGHFTRRCTFPVAMCLEKPE